jgi:hypothetical protein
MLYRMQERVRHEVEEASLAQTILLEVDNLQKQNALTIEGSKKIKYGTRSLFNAPSKKEFIL